MSILLTGGSGRLGTELQQHIVLSAPSRQNLDITNLESIHRAVDIYKPGLIVHAAAYTDVAGAETHKETCWKLNVGGTRNMVKAALEHQLPLIYISTDYVFYGEQGLYKEDDALGPVRNYYALSKLVAEELIRILPRHLVIRTSFRPRVWPYPTAFDDLYTSQDYVDIIALQIALAIKRLKDIPYSTLHIATERKTVYDLAKRRKPDVARASRKNAKVELPEDISLNVERWQDLQGHMREDEKL